MSDHADGSSLTDLRGQFFNASEANANAGGASSGDVVSVTVDATPPTSPTTAAAHHSTTGLSAAKQFFNVPAAAASVGQSSSTAAADDHTNSRGHPTRSNAAGYDMEARPSNASEVTKPTRLRPQREDDTADDSDDALADDCGSGEDDHLAPYSAPLTAAEEQEARMRTYDRVCGPSTLDFLKDTANTIVPDVVTDTVDSSAGAIGRGMHSLVPSGLVHAGDAVGRGAAHVAHAVEAVPQLVVNAIPDAVMSQDTKQLIFTDFSNTLRSFFHTNILSMPFVIQQAGLVSGILLMAMVAITSEYATEAYFGAKNQLRYANRVVTYGDVPLMTWGDWYPSLNVFYGITHLIGFIAFAASNTRVLFGLLFGIHGSAATIASLTVPSLLALPLVFMKHDGGQRFLSMVSNVLIMVSVVIMFTFFSLSPPASVKLWPDTAGDFFLALGVCVYAFTGIGSSIAIERAMSPKRYIRCLRISVACTFALLLAFGITGYLSYGPYTCSVITVSLGKSSRSATVSGLLFLASLAIIPQQTFPLCELCDRWMLGIRTVTTYWDWKANLLRISTLVLSAVVAYVVPYYGLLLSICGALGCGTVGLVVPAALDYVRRVRWGLRKQRYPRWWEYVIVFSLGLYGCAVVGVGVSFGLYRMWIIIQTNAADVC